MNHTLTLTLAMLMLAATGRGQDAKYAKGANDALDAIMLLDLELKLTGERKNWGEMADVVRTRLQLPVKQKVATTRGQTNEQTHLSNLVASEIKKGTIPLGLVTNVPAETTVKIIKAYAASGEICRVLGFHCWEQIASSSNVFSLPGQGKTRKCRICGKVETHKGEWK